MCMRFDCNPPMIFVTFLQFELSFFLLNSSKAYRHLVSSECNFSDKFTTIFIEICRLFWSSSENVYVILIFSKDFTAIIFGIANNKCGDHTVWI